MLRGPWSMLNEPKRSRTRPRWKSAGPRDDIKIGKDGTAGLMWTNGWTWIPYSLYMDVFMEKTSINGDFFIATFDWTCFCFVFLEVPNFLGHHNAGTIWTTANGMVYSPILGFGYPLVDEDHNSHCEGSQWRNHVCWKWCRILNIVNACHICMMINISVHCVINSIIGVCVPITWFQYALDYYASTQCFDNAA